MFRRFGHALIVFALFCAIGAHWAVLQSVAWTNMLAQNLRTGSLSEAVERTFDGQHPCALCKQIAKGKQAERKSELPPQLKKFEYSFSFSRFVFSAPSDFYEVRPSDALVTELIHSPPVPPPKGFSSWAK